MRLTAISIYPVKSGAAMPISTAQLEARGLAGDRRWMIVDPNGRFVSQREQPGLARIIAEPLEGGLRLSIDGETIEVQHPAASAPLRPVRIWDDTLALPEATAASGWLARHFGEGFGLVHQPEQAVRPLGIWATPGAHVSLADGFPVLIATTASLAALNRELPQPLGMDRFRPNLVLEGSEAWAEDSWQSLRVGNVELYLPKPCPRCTITTIDQARGVLDGEEPLATLRRVRMSADRRVPGVLFGWNAVPRSLGEIRVGDTVEVLATRPRWAFRAERDTVSA